MQSSTLINLITGILEDSMKLLKKIEKNIDYQGKLLNSLSEKFDVIGDKIEQSFNNLNNVQLGTFLSDISSRFDLIDVNKLKEIDDEINDISNILQKNFQIQMISILREYVDLNLSFPTRSELTQRSSFFRKSNIISTPSHHSFSKKSQSVDTKIEGDWSESELEGGEIFEKIIIGWKRRDFEKAQGTKEIFMKAWKKLSSYDKAQIKNGAWSKKLIDKIKLLGRN
ncbi:MAG: hypothetical protein ACTSYZ_00200 [Candidatus Helarchaeota archaeon]